MKRIRWKERDREKEMEGKKWRERDGKKEMERKRKGRK